MAVESTIELFSGNDAVITFTVADEDNPPNAKDISGATVIIFAIAKAQGKAPALSVSLGAGIAITDGPNGVFQVTLTKAQTEPLNNKHEYFEARVTDAAGKTATVAFGTADISKNSITT